MTYKHTNLPYTDWNGEKQEEEVVEVEDEEGKKKKPPSETEKPTKIGWEKEKESIVDWGEALHQLGCSAFAHSDFEIQNIRYVFSELVGCDFDFCFILVVCFALS